MTTQLAEDMADCPVCLSSIVNQRYLGCQHVFCVDCLEALRQGNYIRCPVCRIYTVIGDKSVSILPSTSDVTMSKQKPWSVKKISVRGFATSTYIDEKNQRILVASNDSEAPIQIFNFRGEALGIIDNPNLRGLGFSLTFDTKRGRIVTTTNSSIHVLDAEGRWLWAVTDLNAKFNDLAFDEINDRYLFVDRSRDKLISVDPDSRELSECGEDILKCPWAMAARSYISDAMDAHEEMSGAIAVNNFGTRSLRIYHSDPELTMAADIDISTEVLGHLSHICGVTLGKDRDTVLLCDSGYRRIVQVSADGSWECVVGQEEFGFEIPHDVHVSDSGLMVVTSFIERAVEKSHRDSTVYIIQISPDF